MAKRNIIDSIYTKGERKCFSYFKSPKNGRRHLYKVFFMIFKWVDASRKRHCFTPKTILLFSLNENCNRNFKTLGQPMSKTKRHIPMRVFMCIIKVYVKSSELIELKLKMHTSGREGGRMRVRHKQIIEKYFINGVASECKTFQIATQNVAANGRFLWNIHMSSFHRMIEIVRILSSPPFTSMCISFIYTFIKCLFSIIFGLSPC